MTDQNQALAGADPETPKEQYSDSWLETELWPLLSKLDALHELLYCSADGLSEAPPSAEAWRGFASLLKDVHAGVHSAITSWTKFNFMRQAWMPHEATVSLDDIENFIRYARGRGEWLQPGTTVVDVPVSELMRWLEDAYHREPAHSAAPNAEGRIGGVE